MKKGESCAKCQIDKGCSNQFHHVFDLWPTNQYQRGIPSFD